MSIFTPGPGDPTTWGKCCGHTHDPRTPEFDDEFEWPEDDEDAEYQQDERD